MLVDSKVLLLPTVYYYYYYSFAKHLLGDSALHLLAITSIFLVVVIFVKRDLQITFDGDIYIRHCYQKGPSRQKGY